jgi:hypothetical protein
MALTIGYRTLFIRTKGKILTNIYLALITALLYTVATQATVAADSYDFEVKDRELHGVGRDQGGGGFRGRGGRGRHGRRQSQSRLLL